jgi:hypothetical protein
MSKRQTYTLEEVMALYDIFPTSRDMQPNPFIVEEALYPLYPYPPMKNICAAAKPSANPESPPKQTDPISMVTDPPKPKTQFVPPPVFDGDPLVPWGIAVTSQQSSFGFTPPPIRENRQNGRLRDKPVNFTPWNIAIPRGFNGAF